MLRAKIISHFVEEQGITADQRIDQQAFPCPVVTYNSYMFSDSNLQVNRLVQPVKRMTGHAILYRNNVLHDVYVV